jgi:hypothetical protein
MVDVLYELIEGRVTPQEALAAFEELVEFGADPPGLSPPVRAFSTTSTAVGDETHRRRATELIGG